MNLQRPLFVVIVILTALHTPAEAADKHPDIDSVLIYGASGRIGQHIVDEALLRGYAVTGVTRDAARLGAYAGRIDIETADILDRERSTELMAAHDAVIVSIGGMPTDTVPENYIAARAAESVIDILEDLGEDGPRLIFVGSLFTLIYEDGKSLLELGRVDESHEYYAMFYGHEIALERFRASDGIDWTIATPPNGLRLEGRTGNIRFGGDELLRDSDGRPGEISREDFAFAIFEELAAERYVGRRFNVARNRD